MKLENAKQKALNKKTPPPTAAKDKTKKKKKHAKKMKAVANAVLPKDDDKMDDDAASRSSGVSPAKLESTPVKKETRSASPASSEASSLSFDHKLHRLGEELMPKRDFPTVIYYASLHLQADELIFQALQLEMQAASLPPGSESIKRDIQLHAQQMRAKWRAMYAAMEDEFGAPQLP